MLSNCDARGERSCCFSENFLELIEPHGFDEMMIKACYRRLRLIPLLTPTSLGDDRNGLEYVVLTKCTADFIPVHSRQSNITNSPRIIAAVVIHISARAFPPHVVTLSVATARMGRISIASMEISTGLCQTGLQDA
jgi:hypothetical protein